MVVGVVSGNRGKGKVQGWNMFRVPLCFPLACPVAVSSFACIAVALKVALSFYRKHWWGLLQ